MNIRRCERCCLRYETPAGEAAFPCPHCSAARVGIGRSFDEACADAALRLRGQGQNHAWIVSSHRVYTSDVGDAAMTGNPIIHMVRLLRSEYVDE